MNAKRLLLSLSMLFAMAAFYQNCAPSFVGTTGLSSKSSTALSNGTVGRGGTGGTGGTDGTDGTTGNDGSTGEVPVEVPTPIPTPPPPTPTPVPSTDTSTTMPDGSKLSRTCDLPGLANYGRSGDKQRALRTTVRYERCLSMNQVPSTDLTDQYQDGIVDGYIDPLQATWDVFLTQEGKNRYHWDQMDPQSYTVFVFHLLLRREPTLQELAYGVTQQTSGVSKDDLYKYVVQKLLVVEDAYMRDMVALYNSK